MMRRAMVIRYATPDDRPSIWRFMRRTAAAATSARFVAVRRPAVLLCSGRSRGCTTSVGSASAGNATPHGTTRF
jgi:hypothetical protein